MAHLFRSSFDRLYYRRLRNAVGATPFAIVSNNCWGAHVYQQLDLPYTTPFVGTAIRPACYLTLLSDFDRLVQRPVRFIKSSRYADVNVKLATRGPHPIGVLGDGIELHFLHEKTEEEAGDKWRRRVARMPLQTDRRFFKFCDYDRPTAPELSAFASMRLPHKVLFVANSRLIAPSVIDMKCGGDRVVDGMALQTACLPHFDHAAWLSGRDPRPGLTYKALMAGRAA